MLSYPLLWPRKLESWMPLVSSQTLKRGEGLVPSVSYQILWLRHRTAQYWTQGLRSSQSPLSWTLWMETEEMLFYPVRALNNYLRLILARDKRRKCFATGSQELSWHFVCTPKWHFMTSLAKNILGFSPFWVSKSKTRFQHGTKMKWTIGFLFRPVREEHQQQQRSPGSSVAKWVVLKLEKSSKVPHIHKFVSFEI